MNAPIQTPKRMTLSSIKRGVSESPLRVLLYGPEGVGKTSFGANAPDPIFLGTEDGFGNLDVARFPAPRSWKDVTDALLCLETEAHDYKTLVIDSLDWLEVLVWQEVCRLGGKKSIEDFGYGKGYLAALDQWRILLSQCDRIRHIKGLHIVLLAHAKVAPFRNVEGNDYDRYTLKVNDKAAGLSKEWCDCLLFANFTGVYIEKDQRGKGKAIGTPTRTLFTTRRAAFDAKNRFGLPEELPLDWSALYESIRAPKDLSDLIAQITDLLPKVPEEARAKALAFVEQNKDSESKLVVALNRLRTLAQSNEQSNTETNEKENTNNE